VAGCLTAILNLEDLKMAMIFKGFRSNIARKMAKDDPELKRWLGVATFAKTSNGYWLAWHADDVGSILVLPPDDAPDQNCYWIDNGGKNDTLEAAIEYVESGQFAEDEPMVLNLFIQNPETGEWE
jgi:hypothetical protein